MKLWKGATFAFMLCGAALSILLIRNMATIGQFTPNTKHSSSSASRQSSSSKSLSKSSLLSPPSSSSSSTTTSAELRVLSRPMSGLHRRTRSTDEVNSILSECKTNCYFLPSFFVWSEIRCRVKTLQGFRQNIPDCCLQSRL